MNKIEKEKNALFEKKTLSDQDVWFKAFQAFIKSHQASSSFLINFD